MADLEVHVETTDHLDWVDVAVGYGDHFRTLTIRGMDDLYHLKFMIDSYIWDHETEVLDKRLESE
jgi:hypothetical protein